MHICPDCNRRTINFQTPITMMMVMMTGIYVFDAKDLAEIPTGHTQRGREMLKLGEFRQRYEIDT